VTLGVELSVAAGPVGRDARAATDAQLKAEILSYSRTQGLFAGLALSGGILRPDIDDNQDLYGGDVSVEDLLTGGKIEAPAAVQPFMQALQRK
jgi:lipid-binding SYLF domain-containing protein